MTQQSEFAFKLKEALKLAGFNHWENITITNENWDSYKDLSPKEMAVLYSKKHYLVEKEKILKVLSLIWEKRKSSKPYSLSKIAQANGLIQKPFLFLVKHGNVPIKIEGNEKRKKYIWLNNEKPNFEDAEFFWGLYDKMRFANLTKKELEIMDENRELSFMGHVEAFKPIKEEEHLFKLFAIYKHYNYLKVQTNRRKVQLDAKPKSFSKEIKRVPFQTFDNIENVTRNSVANDKNVEKFLNETKPIKLGEVSSEKLKTDGFIFLIKNKAEMYQKLAMDLEEYNAKLENYIVHFLNKTSLS